MAYVGDVDEDNTDKEMLGTLSDSDKDGGEGEEPPGTKVFD